MKKILILMLTISLLSCSNDEIQTPKPNYSAFLNKRTPSLKGKLNSQLINWEFGNEYQMTTGYSNGNGVCSITNPFRILFFGLTDNNDSSNQIFFITPKMDTSKQNEVKNVLSIGQKQFGDSYNKFQFHIRKNNNLYSVSPNSNQKLEILKTEFLSNHNYMLVWIKIDNLELENSNQSGEKIYLKDGFMIAKLYGHIFE